MHILTVVESPSWIEHHIIGSLIEMGHDVHQFSYGAAIGDFYGLAAQGKRRAKNRNLVALATSLARNRKLDLIFCYVYDDFLMTESADALARLGVPMVNLNVDMVNQWYRQIRTAKYFTCVLCAQKDNMASLARYDCRTVYFPMASRLPKPLKDGPSRFVPGAPVTFMGTPMPCRTRVLAGLERAGIPLAVYGRLWTEGRQAQPERTFEKTISDIYHYAVPRLRGEGLSSLLSALNARIEKVASRSDAGSMNALSDRVKHGALPDGVAPCLFSRSKINLGFTRIVGDDPDIPGSNQIKLRDFEVPLAGGFYLVEEAPGYDEHFEPGKEVVTWRTRAELLDKINYYLDHENERTAIAQAGQRRAAAEHTWQRRFETLFHELKLK